MVRAIPGAAVLAALLLIALFAGSASAAFGLKGLDVSFTDADGATAMQAGSHPYAMTVNIEANTKTIPKGPGCSPEAPGVEECDVPDEVIKDLRIHLPEGLVGDPFAMPRCPSVTFVESATQCPTDTIVGKTFVFVGQGADTPGAQALPVYNLTPSPGSVLRLGFAVGPVPVTIEASLSPSPPYNAIISVTNISQVQSLFAAKTVVWGNPADPSHDAERGSCLITGGSCPVSITPRPFLTLPRSCQGPLDTGFEATSWQNPANVLKYTTTTHDDSVPPNPLGPYGCAKLGFTPEIDARPTTLAATTASGLDFSLDLPSNEGLTSPSGISDADIEKTVVTLPEGMTVNPSSANGLEVCSEEQLAKMTPFTDPGVGCPDASRLGSVEVETPILEDKLLKGSLFLATPYENPFGSLIALYVVIQDPELGIKVVQPLRVEPDPDTGRLVSTAEDMPQLPYSHFRLQFREGARGSLVTPPTCGEHTVEALLYPSSGAAPFPTNSTFEIVSGPGGGDCPTGGLSPFHPQLEAGTLNNAAGSFSPFNVRITRTDSEQEITRFSIKLPPGVLANLAGVQTCSDAQIAQAKGRTGPHGGQEELSDPSCPLGSQVGTTLAGAGVGPVLTYVPGKVYLAGPYHGAPLSLVAVTSGVAGPFDIGTVVVRLAIDVNPETGEVFLDSTGSDPIPHIVKGIPVRLRDIRAYTDRPGFTFNPTSCEPTSTAATVLGSGLDFVSPADDNPFVSTSPFQAADCAALPFKPKLRFKLKGGTRRGANPSLRAHVGMNGFGEAAIRFARVTLPKSEFLEQSHIGTICTRVQFNAGAVPGEGCPAASVYGKVVARTPILDQPLAGPIFLRANGGERDLPDLVAALHGSQIDVTLVGFIDSGKNGGIRNTFRFVPDAPVTSADFTFFGGKKSLLSNSRNLCRSVNRVRVELKAHSGKELRYRTPLKPMSCKKGKKKAKSGTKKRR